MNNLSIFLCLVFASVFACADSSSQYWAVAVIDYTPQSPYPSYTNAHVALGPATTEHEDSGSSIRVFEPAFSPNNIVSLGNGGELILQMGQVVTNYDDEMRHYGYDLIVFGNSFFAYWMDTDSAPYNSPWYDIFEERAEIWVSQEMTNWFRARNVYADSYMPTQSTDIEGNPAFFRKPVHPSLLTNDWFTMSWSYTNTVIAYDGSAGGAPVDLSNLETAEGTPTNIPYALYVKLIDVSPGSLSAEIDACCIVEEIPEPAFFYFAGVVLSIFFAARNTRKSA